MEKEISEGDIFSRINPNDETTQYYLLAEDVTELKFRYYELKKLSPQETGDANNSPTQSDSILDWIDADKNHRLNGAENDYYRKQRPPYLAKNGKIEAMDELLKVRGITKEILYGSEDEVEDEKQYKGIINHLTIYNIPTVNPNTATEEVLNILFQPEQVAEIVGNISSKGFHSNTLSSFFRIASTGKIADSLTEHTVEAIVEKSITNGKPQIVIHY